MEIAPNEFSWEFPGKVLKPCETRTIEFDAHVIKCCTDENIQKVKAECVDTGEKVYDEDTATVNVPCILMEGDVTDLNDCVSLKDSTLIKLYLVDKITLTPDQRECADTYDDNAVTLKDSTAIKFWLVDLFPLWESPADEHMLKPVPCIAVLFFKI